jgi:hypothetical protein
MAVAAVAAIALAPTGTGDVGALIAREPAVGESFRVHPIASPFGTIHAATFTFPQPVGTGLPVVRLAALDSDVTGAIARSIIDRADIDQTSSDFPQIDRTAKGPRLVPRVRPHFDALDPAKSDAPEKAEQPEPPSDAPSPAAPAAPAAPESADGSRESASSAAAGKAATEDAELADLEAAEPDAFASLNAESAALHAARIYFGTAPLGGGGSFAAIEPWAPGQAPIFEETAAVTPVSLPGETPRNETIVAKGAIGGEPGEGEGEANGDRTAIPARDTRSASPMRFISKPAASPCAARSRWRRWC